MSKNSNTVLQLKGTLEPVNYGSIDAKIEFDMHEDGLFGITQSQDNTGELFGRYYIESVKHATLVQPMPDLIRQPLQQAYFTIGKWFCGMSDPLGIYSSKPLHTIAQYTTSMKHVIEFFEFDRQDELVRFFIGEKDFDKNIFAPVGSFSGNLYQLQENELDPLNQRHLEFTQTPYYYKNMFDMLKNRIMRSEHHMSFCLEVFEKENETQLD